MRHTRKKILVWIVLILMIAWPIYQLYDYMKVKEDKADATRMLYRVSKFQMELLNTYVQDTVNADSTNELKGLQQSLYSAEFTHNHFVMAIGTKKVKELDGVSELLEYVVRMQLGGIRALTEDERQFFHDIRGLFAELYTTYTLLYSNQGGFNKSQSKQLHEKDIKLSEKIRQYLLQ